MNRLEILRLYENIFELYRYTRRKPELDEIEVCLYQNNTSEAESRLRKFKTEEELLQILEEKLKGKSAYYTLKRIREGKIETLHQAMKGLSSLVTHSIIEAEHGNLEYLQLAKKLNRFLGEKLEGPNV